MKKIIALCLFSILLIETNAQDNDSISNIRFEIGTDIIPIFNSDQDNWPNYLLIRIYHAEKPIAYRFRTQFVSYLHEKEQLIDEETNSSFSLGIAAGIEYYFLIKDNYSLYFGDEIYYSPHINSLKSINNGEFSSHSKSNSFQNNILLGCRIPLYKQISIGIESKLGLNFYRYNDNNNVPKIINKFLVLLQPINSINFQFKF